MCSTNIKINSQRLHAAMTKGRCLKFSSPFTWIVLPSIMKWMINTIWWTNSISGVFYVFFTLGMFMSFFPKSVDNSWSASISKDLSERPDLFLKNHNYTKTKHWNYKQNQTNWPVGSSVYKYQCVFGHFSFKDIIFWLVAFQFKWTGRKISSTSSSSQRYVTLVSIF